MQFDGDSQLTSALPHRPTSHTQQQQQQNQSRQQPDKSIISSDTDRSSSSSSSSFPLARRVPLLSTPMSTHSSVSLSPDPFAYSSADTITTPNTTSKGSSSSSNSSSSNNNSNNNNSNNSSSKGSGSKPFLRKGRLVNLYTNQNFPIFD